MSIPASTLTRVVRELKDLQKNPIDGVRVHPNDDDITEIAAEYDGPTGTPYEGGVFQMKLVLGDDFPSSPPRGVFLTKIFHPNVSEAGDICVNVLKRDWSPDVGIRHVLTVVRCLLVEPNAESALNEEAGKLLLEGFDAFAARARLMTDVHARRPLPLGDSKGHNTAPSGGVSKPKAKAPGAKTAKTAAKKSIRRL